MKIDTLTAENFEEFHADAVTLARDYGEKRIRKTSLAWLRDITPDAVPVDGVFIAHSGSEVDGVSVVTESGGPNFTVVHPDERRKGVATALIQAKLDKHPQYETLVAADNTPSIALLLKVGMVADDLVDNGNGKQVARFVPRATIAKEYGATPAPKQHAKRMHGATLTSPRLARLLAALGASSDGVTGPALAKQTKITALSTAISELRAALRRSGEARTIVCSYEKAGKGRVARYVLK